MNAIDPTPTTFEPEASSSEQSIPLCIPEIRGNEWRYIKECLDTNWVSSVGPFVDRFERELAEYLGTKYAVAVCNGTAALHVSLLVAGVQPEDEVLISDMTFIAPANAIRYVGAWPIFIDAEPSYWQMDPQKVVDFLEKQCHWTQGELRNKTTHRRVTAILPVHILGHPVDMDPILSVARKYHLVVIEDATESLGATYKGQMVGTLGDIACFSFNGNKIITTGGGGMIITDNAQWARKAKYLTTQAKDDPLEYIHNEIGFNYRLSNLHSAMGVAQLELLDEFIAIKRSIAKKYNTAFAQFPDISPMPEAEWASSIFWMYTVLVDATRCGIDSRTIRRSLEHQHIQTRPLWQPLHMSPAHQYAVNMDCAVSERLNRDAISLPCSVGLTDDQQEMVISQLAKAIDQ